MHNDNANVSSFNSSDNNSLCSTCSLLPHYEHWTGVADVNVWDVLMWSFVII